MRPFPFIKYTFLLLPVLLLLYSCTEDNNLPKGVISVNKMSSVMLDMQLAKAYNYSYVSDTLDYPNDPEERLKFFYQQILMLHKTDTPKFFKSFRFYENHPDWIQKVYTLMQDSLKQKQARQKFLLKKEEQLTRQKTQARSIQMPWQRFFRDWNTIRDSLNQTSSRQVFKGLY